MSIATEILSLRRDQSSSVATLIGPLDWQRSSPRPTYSYQQVYALTQAVDAVLLNVAAHAAEALNASDTPVNAPQSPKAPEARRTIRSLFRRRRGSDAPKSRQRIRGSFA
jgi:hypothetical protein